MTTDQEMNEEREEQRRRERDPQVGHTLRAYFRGGAVMVRQVHLRDENRMFVIDWRYREFPYQSQRGVCRGHWINVKDFTRDPMITQGRIDLCPLHFDDPNVEGWLP
jgi:hypothetical protein